MAGEPENLNLLHLRQLFKQLTQTNQKLDELGSRLPSLEQEVLILQQHRLRHEIQLGDFHVNVGEIQRRLEISDGRD